MKKLSQHADLFLNYCETQKKLTCSTLKAYQFDLEHFQRFIAVEKKVNP